jgi:hypothetical protein
MNKYLILIGIVSALLLGYYFSNNFYNLAEKIAWEKCIGADQYVNQISGYTPTGAENLLCKSLYPKPYSAWAKIYYAK